MKLNTLQMKKKIARSLALVFAAVVAIGIIGCDEKDKNDRYIELPAVESERVVLLEEFTGQKCVNCPDGHALVAQLTEQYPNNFIGVGIHGGGDTWSFGEDQIEGGLRNSDGQKYSEEAGATTFPCGVVNRNSGLLNKEQWANAVREEMEKTANLEISLSAQLDKDGQNIVINTNIIPYANISGNLQLWVIEDGIVAMQLSSSGLDKNYVHNHVFRACVNGHNGESVNLTTREEQSFTHSIAVDSRWNAANLDIVAFVYTGNGVEQAAKTAVNSEQ